ncbi:zona pellucida sperm-binding protein 3-like isoform X2 [Sinocyclocheilus rhinocerous]|uniref:zona pellucida sperm-binding protein 3-like isoform X2 n=1 Tax=Sinocyclocheilus rhinocerous TaxID=307959 RepID=UPI0007B9089B|nr:PREDICTED: zona pellucida sperm-binding protein 3-like isoform X2 [Sinocyclocheilus rhinocerous]
MVLMYFISAGFFLLIAVDLSLAQWSGFQQGQDPTRFQQQQSTVLAPQRAVQSLQTSAAFRPTRPVMSPAWVDPWKFQEPGNTQSKRLMQAPVAPLTWHFPVVPEEPQQPDVPFELHVPIPARSIAAQCGESSVHVEVKKDFFGTGQLVNPSFLSLGGCAVVGEDPEAQVLIFEYELQTCGSSLTMTDNELVYTFTLLYTPEALVGTPIVRTDAAAVGIECHYSRLHNVSSNVLIPSWVPFAATKVAEEVLVFSLKLMTDDWMFERPSNQYFLGQFLRVEASVKQYNHVPLRLFVDGCVATAVPDVNSALRYSFIENHGCLVDAELTGSTSSFMRRVQNDKLHFQLESFRFQQSNSALVYITCALKAVVASTPISPENKACSFANGWLSADDNDQVCMCCVSTCGSSWKGQALSDSEGKATIGPIVVSN